MTNRNGDRRRLRAPAWALALGVGVCLAAGSAEAVTSKTWKQRDRSDFEMGEPKGVSLSADGPVRLGARVEALDAGDASYVWAVAAGPKGAIYAAGGNDGAILRFEPGSARGVPFFHASEPEVQAIAVDAAGAVYAGTSPGGRIYKITPEGKQVWVCDTGEKYVWSLLFDRQGGLIAATGNEGRVLRLDATGHSRILFDTAETHVRSLALDAQGRLLAGTDGHGLVFRIGDDGKGVVLYDAPLPEVAALAASADGVIYAAVVGEAGHSPRPSPQRPQPPQPTDSAEPAPPAASSQGAPESTSQQAPLESRPPLSMEGKVLAIAPDGYAREVWSGTQEAILSLALTRRGGLLMGDSKEGRIFQLEPGGGVSEIARSESSQVTALLRRPGTGDHEDEVIVAGSNLGRVDLIKPGFAPTGTFTSRVFDAQSFATWGRIAWRADQPSGTSVALQARSGNTEEPDRTWSEWGAELREPNGAPVGIPAARFVQWRALLATKDPARTPEVREVALVYLPRNLPPEFRKVEVQAVGVTFQKVPAASSGTPQEGKPAGAETDPLARRRNRPQSRRGFDPGARSITWQVVDPNDDDVTFDVQYRALDEKNWKTIRKGIDEDFVTFDGATLPDGTYLVRLVASDAASNPAGQALTAEKILSAPFDVDNTPPRIDRFKPVLSRETLHVTFAASDSFSVVREAAYSVDAGDWVPAPPSDGLSDSLQESYDLSLPSPAPGEHSIVVRAIDAAGNVGSGRAVVEVP